jgi:hypothetical protein
MATTSLPGTNWGNLIFGGTAALSGLFSGRSASKAASEAAALTREQLQFDQGMARRSVDISEEAGDALSAALEQFVATYGSAGSFDPNAIAALSDLFADERTGFRTGMQGAAEREGATAFGRDAAMGRGFAAFADDMGFTPGADYSSYFGDVGAPDTDISVREGVYDGLVDRLATAYLDKFSYETDRSAREALASQDADAISRGLERSTYDIESEKGVADVVARRRNQDVIAAVEQAIGHVGKLQGLDTGNLQMRMSEFGGELERGGFGLRLGGTRLEADHAEMQDRIQGVGAGQGLLGGASAYYWGNRSQPIREMASIISATPNDTYETGQMAIGQTGALQGLRNNTLQEVVTMATAPYATRLQGFTPGAQFSRNANAGTGTLLDSSTRASVAAGSAFGTGLERLSNVDWSKIRF